MIIQLIITILVAVFCLGIGFYLGYSEGFYVGYTKCLEYNSKKVKKVFKK
ncbi:hypothetical protein vBBak6_080 [Bacillus phage v_B-Bak6]|uniref:Uncharacterized protein n=2 Tax=Basiliskvirus TaxID=3044670 RepID=A0A385IK64_9CAUD|nr:hypothetical protein PP653_gp078 [Bacillus phage Basilisk]YP_010656984.1 hypothetical protein PP654_gp065 [Bacillus phage v_B-Bak10]AXY83040.1 hypothetical protein vBBak1_080 [Bacillus phage v_B-Bak1]AXY83160.1 hypothetical protein vBBak6_080 [Bacillus phage v_B-Bak6]AGR46690.1 hypothetical protein BASILISK_89 [Bacillus phage Basilisk]AXY83307.1 hypothetical protein vBBBak10_077 [Bacillus phage v_B-Bak10]